MPKPNIYIRIDIGGNKNDSVQEETVVTLTGCPCRLPDFLIALVKFTNEWKLQADSQKKEFNGEVKPCGCADAK